jgi:universal stress protein A
MFVPKRILVPTDFSEYSDKALAAAQDIAKCFNAKIDVLHVVDEGLHECADQYCIDPAIMNKVREAGIRGSQEKMQAEADRVKQDGVETEFSIRQGTPYDEILKEQQEKQIDLIVIATHGRTGLLSHLIGSVAEKVSRSARCPVLLVRS